MNELTATAPKNFKPRGDDIAALSSLVGFLNNPEITGASAPPRESQPSDVSPEPSAPQPRPSALPRLDAVKHRRIFLTGRMRSGKDRFANIINGIILGFADPLYALQKLFFGTDDKTLPGARAFLQGVGQAGRGEGALSVERACLLTIISSFAKGNHLPAHLGVDWARYGKDNRIWLDALLSRAAGIANAQPTSRLVVTNVRFENEFRALADAGWVHYHLLCSPETHNKRLAVSGLRSDSPEVSGPTEALAIKLDADVRKSLAIHATGPMLRAVWSDENAAAPSARLFTPQSFMQALEGSAA